MLQGILEHLRETGKVVVADYDDLIFGNDLLALDSSLAKRKSTTAQEVVQLFAENTEALRLFEKVAVSTYPLAKMVGEFHPTAAVEVVPNTLPESIFELSKKLELPRRTRLARQIGYFCGTNSHNLDFRVVSDTVQQMLDEFEDATFVVVGPLELPTALSVHPRVLVQPACDYWYLSSIMSRCSIAIAPLELGAFNNCKSRVKFLEATVAGCELIATPIDDMRRIAAGRARLPNTQMQWQDALAASLSGDTLTSDNFEFVRSTSHASHHASGLQELFEL